MSDTNNSGREQLEEQLEEQVKNNVKSFVKNTYKKAMIFVMIFSFFVINLFALSLSLHCNKNSSIGIRLSAGLFAFMFGFFYILVNYYFYRAGNTQNQDLCKICSKNPFGFVPNVRLGSKIISEVKKTADAIRPSA